ncbi:hypothetical protein Gotur_030048, partial [Gossypium turneri]
EKLVFREVFTFVQDSGPLSAYIRTYVFALVHTRLLDRELIMENGFFDKVEDNAAVQAWSETTQRGKGDSLAEGYVSELWDFTRISVTQNRLQELKKSGISRMMGFGILLTVVSLLGEVIWYLQWRNTWLYFVAQRFKQIEFTRELLMS